MTERSPAAGPAVAGSGADEIRVLHVDDDPEFVDLTAAYLERVGDRIVVETATDTAAALAALDERPVDCVVSDYEMPGMDGLEFLAAVRESHPELPFVLFTGKGSEEIASEAVSAGVTDYLQKGGTEVYDVLANRVESAVRERRAREGLDHTRRWYRALIERSTDVVVVLDDEDRTTYTSPAVDRLFGDRAPEPGDALLPHVHPDDREAVRAAVEAARADAGRAPEPVEFRVRTDGGDRWLEATVVDQRDTAVEGVVVNAREVTERRRHEERLEALHAVATDFAAADSPAEVYERTVRAASELLAFDLCVINVERDGMLEVAAISENLPPGGVEPMSLDEGLTGLTYRTGESLLVDDVTAHPEANPQGPYRSAVSVPLGDHGVFQTVDEAAGAFDADDLRLAELLVAHAAAAVDRLRTTAELKRQRDRFAALFENLPSPTAFVDLGEDGPRIREVNPGFAETFDVDAEAVVGEPLNEVVVPEDRDEEARALDGRVRDRGVVSAEVRRGTAEGVRDFRLVYVLHNPDADRPEGYAIYTDISGPKERERQFEALYEATQRLIRADSREAVAELAVETADRILGMSINGVWFWEPDREALVPAAWTDRSEALLEEVPVFDGSGSVSWEVFHEGERRAFSDVRTAEEPYSEDTVIRSELVLPLGDHGVANVGETEPDAFDETDAALVDLWMTAVRNVLDRLERERQLRDRERDLERQNERLEEFTSLVSHDLRSPLNVAAGNLTLAAEECDSEYLADVAAAHNRMDDLIDDLLALARTGDPVEDRTTVALDALARECWAAAATPEATLSVPASLRVRAHEGQVRQLLENLLRNAVEHGGADADVTLDALPDGDGFYVADDGPGVPPDRREQVFETGFTTDGEGHGFGLRIVRNVAEAHGWSVSVTESEDGGARFEVAGVDVVDD